MPAQPRPDVIDTPLVYRTYAVIVGLGGFVLAGWGQIWLGSDLPGQPWGKAALIRVFGSILMAAGCFAAALAMIEDPKSRRRSLLWFTAAHFVAGCMVFLQNWAIWESPVGGWAAAVLLNISLVLVCYWATYWKVIEGRPFAFETMSLFGGDSHPAGSLRSRYEQQIRQAAAQEERNRLARDLHDSIKQQVFVIQTAAATAQTRFESDPNGARLALEQVRGSSREAMSEMEAMLDQLRAEPLENAGLVAALKKQCEALGFRTGARVEFNLGTLPPSTALAPGAQEAIFRVAQEALANIGRHARAGSVVVALDSVNRRVWLSVRDDGAGFDPNLSANGMGMANMRARAKEFGGEFELWSRPGGGTSIQFSLPCTVIKPANFRQQTILLGAAVAALSAFLFVKGVNSGVIPGLILAVIGFAHNLTAWLRTRKQSKAAQ